MIDITKKGLRALVAVQAASLIMSAASVGMVGLIVRNDPSACLTSDCAANIEASTRIESDTASVGSETGLPATEAEPLADSPAVAGSADAASVRAMILDEYDNFIKTTESYAETQYATLADLHDKADSVGSKILTEPSDSADWKIENAYLSVWQSYTKDINIKINNAVIDDCDLNHLITTEDEHQYCRDVFTNSKEISALQNASFLFQKS